ncbi:MAG: hypothetical protein R2850_00550 [Bacteroidia bacterium]
MFKCSWGASGITQGNTYEGRNLIPNFRNYSGGVFAVERLKLLKAWNLKLVQGTITNGFRFTAINMQEAVRLHIGYTASFLKIAEISGAIFKPDSLLNFSVNLGTARRNRHNELYSYGLHHGAASIEYGDDSLKSNGPIILYSQLII